MPYSLQFSPLTHYSHYFLDGVWLTIQLSTLSIGFGCMFGILLASLVSSGNRVFRILIITYVEIIRNTPFLIQLFILVFGMPLIGIHIDPRTAALIGMIINLTAYTTEIIRSGIDSIHPSQREAGAALGLTRWQIYQYIIILPALEKVYPALCSQFVLMMLSSSICSTIATEELTAAAAFVESQIYKPFEIYTIVALIYLLLVFQLRLILAFIGRYLFHRRSIVPNLAPIEVRL